MGLLLERIAERAATNPLLWLEHFAYSGRLLAGGAIPWHDPAAFLAYYRKAQSLLKPGVAAVPLDPFFAARLADDAGLRAEMAGQRRVELALKTMLAAAGPRALLATIVKAVRSACGSQPLVLTLPSPRCWLEWTGALPPDSAGPPATRSGDAADAAAMYLADFLRIFAELRVDGLLVEDTPSRAPAAEASWYQPIIGVARHYRWDVGVMSALETAAAAGWDYCIGGAAMPPGVIGGVMLSDEFWAGEAPPALAGIGFYFARVPAAALPERVLERVAVLW